MNLKDIYQNVIDGKPSEVESGVKDALADGISAEDILNYALIAPMDEIGRGFECGDLFVPEMLVSAHAMQSGLQYLKPYLATADVRVVGKVAIGSVKGDLHDIGKNLVTMMLEGSGFEVVDLGVDVPVDTFVNAAKNGAQIICMSSLLTTTMASMENVIQAITAAGLRDKVKVMIGGAPITLDFANKIGADGYAPDASSATRVAHQLVGIEL